MLVNISVKQVNSNPCKCNYVAGVATSQFAANLAIVCLGIEDLWQGSEIENNEILMRCSSRDKSLNLPSTPLWLIAFRLETLKLESQGWSQGESQGAKTNEGPTTRGEQMSWNPT